MLKIITKGKWKGGTGALPQLAQKIRQVKVMKEQLNEMILYKRFWMLKGLSSLA